MTNLSNLTQEQIKELEELNNLSVDYSDIPLTTDFSKAKFKYYNLQPKKQTITFRIDMNILAILKSYGKGYQSKMNEILRSVLL